MLVTHPQIKSHIYSDEIIKKNDKDCDIMEKRDDLKKKKSVNAMI